MAQPQRRGKTIGAAVAKCSSLQGLNPAIFLVVFPRLLEMVTACRGRSSLSVRVITPPPLLCVQVSTDCLMDPAPAICVLRAADLANGLIQHYAERPAALTCNAANGRGL